MRHFLTSSLLAALLITNCQTVPKNAPPELPTEQKAAMSVVAANNAFTADMLAALAQSEEGNIFVSPLSLSTAMGMLQAGARGETKAEIDRVFRYPATNLHTELGVLRARASRVVEPDPRMGKDGGDPQILSIANSVWVDKGFPLKAGYVDTLKRDYDAVPNKVDFANQPDASRETINSWVEDKTQDRIENLLSSGDITGDTAFVLVNAIYMMAHWQDVFYENDTKDGSFLIDGAEKADRPLMRKMDDFQQLDIPGGEALRLPYANDMSLIVMLPESGRGLGPVNAMMTPASIDYVLSNIEGAETQYTDLALPKFTLKARYKLNPTLQSLGLQSIFVRPDLSGASDDKRLAVGPVIQQVFLDVNEKGTEAAAATAITVVLTSGRMPRTPEPFIVDRPFVMLIRDDITGAVVFAGRITNPEPPKE